MELEQEQELEKVIISLENLVISQPPLPPLSELETITGYTFKNKELLKQAFTHASYKADDSNSYERLEYLGDSVLNHLVAKLHYFMYPNMMPGELTRLRAANVDTEALARAALKYKLHKYLRHKKPLLDKKVVNFFGVFI
ncbi:Ribonuclease III domain-containing protein [Artemisia annua]|uniref:Ribonuclease III domain-containing protein n=1 Tax=Artemisia annua TaxID=35608 RepID=A0A2U1M621_ARTAN|nr:Ribonuclease III domain-containing protein [Artemisia annua]